MKKFILILMLLLPLAASAGNDYQFSVLKEIALQGELQKSGFYLNSKNCLNEDSLHVAYDQKTGILIFGYFHSRTGMIKNYIWDRKKGETSTLSCRFDKVIDPTKAIKILENEMKDSALRFRADWLACK